MSVFLCYEPDHRTVANALCEFGPTQTSLNGYDARIAHSPDSAASDADRRRMTDEIQAADVLICIVGQTTFLDPWVNWEIQQFKARPDRKGMVGVILHKLFTPPQSMANAGSIFCNLKRDKVAMAVETAMELDDLSEDYAIEE